MKLKIGRSIPLLLQEINNFINFLKNKISFPWICIILFLSYSALVFNFSVGIDDEAMTYYLEEGIIRYGRIGASIMNQLFPSFAFIPHWTALIGLIFCTIDIILWCYIMDREVGFSKPIIMFALSTMISFPYIAKFAIFNGNLMTMGYVLFFTVIAFDIACKLFLTTNFKKIFFLVFCLVLVFLFEKAYIIFFCQSIAAVLLFHIRFNKQKRPLQKIFNFCLILIVAFVFSQIIIKLYQNYKNLSPFNYSDSYIRYNITSIKAFGESILLFAKGCISRIYSSIQNFSGGFIYIISVTIFIVLTIIDSIQKKNIWIVILAFCNIILSASTYIVTGNAWLPERVVCFNYAFFIVVSILYCGHIYQHNKKALHILYLVLFILIANQSREMTLIYNDKNETFAKDKRTAELLLNKIEEKCGTVATYSKPIIFLGFPDNLSASYGDVEKTSIFVWDRNSSTSLEENAQRIYRFYDCLGYHLETPSVLENFYTARKLIGNMASFPEDGCIRNEKDYILVKLGNSLCEILTDYKISNESPKLQGNIEQFSYDDVNKTISINGWLVNRGENSYNNNISLLLKSNSNKESYRLRMDSYNRKDITQHFSDGYNYDNSGINSILSISDYVDSGNYSVYLELKCNNITYQYSTGNTFVINNNQQ